MEQGVTENLDRSGGTANNTVSAPGVGVGHAANGRPIGSTGSGLGSPENPINGSQ